MVCKALLLPDCFAFDKGEEAILIFPNQFVANEIIALGEIPLMNVYNNFGTAILGDATTYPFAVQSITYGFLPAPQAMTVNRVIIAMATLLALYSFFRAFFGRFEATLVSMVSLFTPGFFWHFAQHLYQAALLMFACFLVVFVKHGRGEIGARAMTLLVFALGLVFILSVSINLVAIAIPFLLVASAFLGGERWKRALAGTAAGFIAAFVAGAPEILAFAENISDGYRLDVLYGKQYGFDGFRVLAGLIAQDFRIPNGHLDVSLYFSLAVLVTAPVGIWLLLAGPSSERRIGFMVALLGMAPVLVIAFLIAVPEVWWRIPLLRATDITRVWWFSNVFLCLAVARFIIAAVHRQLSRGAMAGALVGASLMVSIVAASGQGEWIKPFYWFGAGLFMVLMAWYAVAVGRGRK